MRILLILSFCMVAFGEQGSLFEPKSIETSKIEDKAGVLLPNIEMIDQAGHIVFLYDYLKTENPLPVVFTLGYYGCPMLCTLVLNGLVDVINNSGKKPGKDFIIVSLSIDEKEDFTLAKAKQKNYLTAANIEDENYWSFHVADKKNIDEIASALGFNFYFDKRSEQIAHGAGIFFLSPVTKVLSRTLYGIEFSTSDFNLSLMEARQGLFGSFIDKVILSCFHYDPVAGSYSFYIFGVMRIACLLMILIMALYLGINFKREAKIYGFGRTTKNESA